MLPCLNITYFIFYCLKSHKQSYSSFRNIHTKTIPSYQCTLIYKLLKPICTLSVTVTIAFRCHFLISDCYKMCIVYWRKSITGLSKKQLLRIMKPLSLIVRLALIPKILVFPLPTFILIKWMCRVIYNFLVKHTTESEYIPYAAGKVKVWGNTFVENKMKWKMKKHSRNSLINEYAPVQQYRYIDE